MAFRSGRVGEGCNLQPTIVAGGGEGCNSQSKIVAFRLGGGGRAVTQPTMLAFRMGTTKPTMMAFTLGERGKG